ncbi:MAG TPA: IMP dehydrogenase, partial [Armatimonadota bacterium]|nr:IMP dehydrogenase [Armatimonadota bacterium]
MATYYTEPSRTFSEYLLLPNLTAKDCTPDSVDLSTPLVRYRRGTKPSLSISLPFSSAIMQSVSDDNMAIALAELGGVSFLYGSQSVEKQAQMVRNVKAKNLFVGAGINTRDYADRVPALVEAGVDILCIDSSDGYSEWQRDTIEYIKAKYNGTVKVGAGNVVGREGFLYLADAGADFVKVGIGGGSMCITRETKGIGRGQASALIDVARARDEYFIATDTYVPICSDGGIAHDHHIAFALGMGANFVMMGRYFAGFDESPTRKLQVGDQWVKEFWGEGSSRARNWQRYDMGGTNSLEFEEGIDCYIPA